MAVSTSFYITSTVHLMYLISINAFMMSSLSYQLKNKKPSDIVKDIIIKQHDCKGSDVPNWEFCQNPAAQRPQSRWTCSIFLVSGVTETCLVNNPHLLLLGTLLLYANKTSGFMSRLSALGHVPHRLWLEGKGPRNKIWLLPCRPGVRHRPSEWSVGRQAPQNMSR